MKKIKYIFLIIAIPLFAVDSTVPKYEYYLSDKLFTVSPGSDSAYIDAIDVSCRLKEDGKGVRKKFFSFRPLHVWQSPNGDRIQLTDNLPAINALSEYVLKKERDKGQPLSEEYVLERMLFIHGRQRPGGELVYPGAGKIREQYLAALKKHVSTDRYATIVGMLPETKVSKTQDRWEYAHATITKEGAIEKHTYSGYYNPLYIKKHEIEVMMPVGTIPTFEFLPECSAEDD
jgi:hypothetical protein